MHPILKLVETTGSLRQIDCKAGGNTEIALTF